MLVRKGLAMEGYPDVEQCRILIAAERCPRCLEDGKLVTHGLLLLVSLQPLAHRTATNYP